MGGLVEDVENTCNEKHRSWLSSIHQVLDLTRTSRDQLTGNLIMNHINNDNLAEVVHVRNNYLGIWIFRDECVKQKLGAREHKKVRCLYLCSRNELPPKPEAGNKWYADLQMQQLPAGCEIGSRPRVPVEKDDHFNDIQEKRLKG
jgi:hypothetical protein